MAFNDNYLSDMTGPISQALQAMDSLEKGGKANPDEDRMVGHYWLRNPALAPTTEIKESIEQTQKAIKEFADDVHAGRVIPQKADGFYIALVIGIGGSALGPQFVDDALGGSGESMLLRFIDNTDPDGFDQILSELDGSLHETLTIVVSKSGGTIETHNAMIEVSSAYERAGLEFAKHAVAITCENSKLHRKATNENWLQTFPIWDWVGGRTSVFSAVGLLPAALQGIDVDAMLEGASMCDKSTRDENISSNPAAILALMWHYSSRIRNKKNMVILPYRDRLLLFSRYLQQLVMESIGKATDRDGAVIHEGLTVFGNKGTTDQHALVQQLQEGRNDFFTTFIHAQAARADKSADVGNGMTAGDYLSAFLYGTRDALYRADRESITITLDSLNARSIGALMALFERAVGLYAELLNINAYHQPGVEMGKKSASELIELLQSVLAYLNDNRQTSFSAEQVAQAINQNEQVESIYHSLENTAASGEHGIERDGGTTPGSKKYQAG